MKEFPASVSVIYVLVINFNWNERHLLILFEFLE